MGWRSALRSIAAAQRQAARENIRRQKLALKRQAEIQKINAINEAASEVQATLDHLHTALSLHTRCAPRIDWSALERQPRPPAPAPSHAQEQVARTKRAHYSATWLDKLFGRTLRRIEALDQNITSARAEDEAANRDAVARHIQAVADWKSNQVFASRMLAFDTAAWKEAFHQHSTLAHEKLLGTQFHIDFHPNATIGVRLQVSDENVIPTQTKSLLASGKLSVKKTPPNEYWDTYQHYVCSALIRVARELRAILPLKMQYVTATRDLLDESTGHIKLQAILSVKLPPDTLDRLDYTSLDPLSALTNFVHHMDFRRGKGFRPITPLTVEESH